MYKVKILLVWVFYITNERDNGNETGSKKYRSHRNVNYSAPFACRSLRLKYLPRLFKNCHFSCWCIFFDVGVKKRIVVVSIRIRSNRKLDLDNLKYSNMPSNNMSPCVFVEAVIVLDSRRNFSLCFFDFLRAFQKFKIAKRIEQM